MMAQHHCLLDVQARKHVSMITLIVCRSLKRTGMFQHPPMALDKDGAAVPCLDMEAIIRSVQETYGRLTLSSIIRAARLELIHLQSCLLSGVGNAFCGEQAPLMILVTKS